MPFVIEFTWLALYLINISNIINIKHILEQISECLERANYAKQYVMWQPPIFLLFGWNILMIEYTVYYIFI